jgi:hypothetical protein
MCGNVRIADHPTATRRTTPIRGTIRGCKHALGCCRYARQDPLVAYRRDSYDMFEAVLLKFQEDAVRFMFRRQILGADGQPVGAAPAPIASSRGPRPSPAPIRLSSTMQ